MSKNSRHKDGVGKVALEGLAVNGPPLCLPPKATSSQRDGDGHGDKGDLFKKIHFDQFL